MKKSLVVGLAVAAACSACTRAPAPGETSPHVTTSVAPVGMAVGPDLPAFLKASRPQARQGFARLPDRGDLIGYPTRRVVRADGAYTWYRADLSEAHALKAVADGRMRVTMPDGSAVDFRYERHVEHPSGDWTWVGHALAGRTSDEIVVTFGDKAAFGTIARPGHTPLNLVMRDGASWLVEADPAKVAQIVNPATRPTGPDFLLPPPMAAAGGIAAGASGGLVGAAAAANAATTVDVVLGYTPGFASYHGGQSQAVTRLNFMVDVTNEAYINSQVDARVRLVHAMQVDYADATDNGEALEALTGYKSGTGTIPVPAALQPLRAARDQYGGDVVSLVRKFNTPENDGCGIAWLIGGGRTTIDGNDAPFAYSVVSDGQDAGTDGKTYFCRQETLAHEMGHNMGLQHDRDTADGDDNVLQNNEYGAFSYSFGYKTAAGAGNFYTVMAYGDSGQTAYRIFSNPRVLSCTGLPCGQAETADNARALGQTMPIIATFRAAVVPHGPRPAQDMNGDGRSDVLFLNTNGLVSYWLLNGSTVIGSGSVSIATGFRPKGVNDFDGDGRADILVDDGRNLSIYFNGQGGYYVLGVGTYGDGWAVFGSADINGDARGDILFQHPSGAFAYWALNGATVTGSGSGMLPSGYSLQLTGDYNGDRRTDLIASDGRNMLMLLWNGTWFGGYSFASYSDGWRPVKSVDFNGDARADLLFEHPSGAVAYWLLNANTVVGSAAWTRPASYSARAFGDYNGDGQYDVINSDGRNMLMWLWNGYGFGGYPFGYYDAGWSMLAVK